MKTEIIFINDIPSLTPANIVTEHIKNLFCGNEPIMVTYCDTENLFAAFRKAVNKNKLVFIFRNEALTYATNSKIILRFKDVDYFEDSSMLSGTSKKTIVGIADIDSENCGKLFAHIFAKYVYKNVGQYSCYNTLALSGYTMDKANELLENYFDSNACRVFAQDLKSHIRLHMFTFSQTEEDSRVESENNLSRLRMVFGDDSYIPFGKNIAENVIKQLIYHNLKLATAESCTAGMLSGAITSVAGSSEIFEIGISSYSNRIKNAALGVSGDTIKTHGAVSKETAYEMAQGILHLSDADLGISITGVAGPAHSEDKPVGLVYIALADKNHTWIIKNQFDSELSREEIRNKSVYAAFDLLRRYLQCYPSTLPDFCTDQNNLTVITAQPHILNNQQQVNSNILLNSEYEKSPDAAVEEADDIWSSNIVATPENALPDEENEYPTDEASKPIKTEHKKSFIKKIITFSVIGIVVLAIVLGGVFSLVFFNDKRVNDNALEDARSLWTFDESFNAYGQYTCFNELRNLNNEIYGWLKIGNTKINNPVCLGNDNQYYQNHNHLKDKTKYGSLFFDSRSDADKNKLNQNTVIFGNNMKDGEMFGSLGEYLKASYIKANLDIELTTIYNHNSYRIFSVIILSSDTKDANGYFDYTKREFKDEAEFNAWINDAQLRSLYIINQNHKFTDQYVTLVTDADFFEGAKLVIIARRILENDTNPTISTNPSTKYPQIWYDKHSISNPYINEPSSEPSSSTPPTSSDDTSSDNDSTSSDDTTTQSQPTVNPNTNPSRPNPNPSNPNPSNPNPSNPEPSDPEPSDPEPSDPEPSDPEPSDPEPSDPEPSDPEPSDPEPSDPEPSDPEPSDPEPSDPEPSDPEPSSAPSNEEPEA